ncbi:HSP20-like chaperone [Dipodascopsis uninucleata]
MALGRRISIFDSFFDDSFFPFSSPLSLHSSFFSPSLLSDFERGSHSFVPRFDIRETENSFYLDGELPGVEKDNLDIDLIDQNTLRIKGSIERRQELVNGDSRIEEISAEVGGGKEAKSTQVETPSHSYWAAERHVGRFSRTFRFPRAIDSSGITAILKNGLLRIKVPKLDHEPNTRRITINTE